MKVRKDTGVKIGDRLLTRKQLCQTLQITVRTAERWCRDGGGPPYVRIGRNVRYSSAAVEAWLADRTFRHQAAEAAAV